jgi:hypothetical protein
MFLQQPADQLENLLQFPVFQSADERLDEIVVGKFLQVINNGVFVRLPIGPESYQAVVGFHKSMRVFGHGPPCRRMTLRWWLTGNPSTIDEKPAGVNIAGKTTIGVLKTHPCA